MRFVKAVAFYIMFLFLTAGVVLGSMWAIAARSGHRGLFNDWMVEIGEAGKEAGEYLIKIPK